MKKIILFLALFMAFSITSEAQKPQSPRMQTQDKILGSTVTIDYGAPSVRDREIWGSLVPYNKVWRAGANENTTIEFENEVRIDGKMLPAGKYGFFIIPQESGDWVLIFNKRNADWGASKYDMKEDAMRVTVRPEFVDENEEVMHFRIIENTIVFAWEKVRIVFPFTPL